MAVNGSPESQLTHVERMRRATRQGRFGKGQAIGGLAYVGTADHNVQVLLSIGNWGSLTQSCTYSLQVATLHQMQCINLH